MLKPWASNWGLLMEATDVTNGFAYDLKVLGHCPMPRQWCPMQAKPGRPDFTTENRLQEGGQPWCPDSCFISPFRPQCRSVSAMGWDDAGYNAEGRCLRKDQPHAIRLGIIQHWRSPSVGVLARTPWRKSSLWDSSWVVILTLTSFLRMAWREWQEE